jgi:hypothetical protein
MSMFGPTHIVAADSHASGPIVADGVTACERRALTAAIQLLPRAPQRIAVIDAADATGDTRTTLLRLDTFVTKGGAVVYVLRHSALLQGACRNSAFHLLALAAVLWHEMAHVDGADERMARIREQELWTSFVRDQRVDGTIGLRYLTALARRPDDQLLALR